MPWISLPRKIEPKQCAWNEGEPCMEMISVETIAMSPTVKYCIPHSASAKARSARKGIEKNKAKREALKAKEAGD